MNATALARDSGKVRCGSCGRKYSALDFLYDDYAGAQAAIRVGKAGTGPPVLGDTAALEKDLELDRQIRAPTSLQARGDRTRWAWYVLVVLLALVTLFNFAWTFRFDLLEAPLTRELLARHGMAEDAGAREFREPTQILLVSRDFHAHPSQTGILVLSASFVSLSDQPQPYPVLAITLLDADNRALANREFLPREYLLEGVDGAALMQPDVHVPILLEFVDPGEKAVGFELEFH